MMNRFIYLFLLLGCTVLATVGCTDDPNVEPMSPGSVGEGSSWVTIDFSDNSFDEVNITTRATLDNIAESRVGNLFVFVFGPQDETGDAQRLYGRYFDASNRVESSTLPAKKECWYVQGNATIDDPSGSVQILAPKVTNGSLYILANINSDMVNVSPDKLRFVHTLKDLKALAATLNQQIAERNGFFPMTGWAEGVSISSSGITVPTSVANPNGKILLTRLDAKVEVKVRVAKGYMGINTSETDETVDTGQGPVTSTTLVKTIHTIDSFKPLSWQVVNLPRTTFVLPRLNKEDARGEDGKKEMFNTREIKFETRKPVTFPYVQEIIKKKDDGQFEYDYEYETDASGNYLTDANGNKIPKKSTQDSIATTDEHGFSFYMLENRHDPNNNKYLSNGTPTGETKPLIEGNNYHLRDKRNKDAAGAYDTTKGLWEYAPEEGTYLVIKGEIIMALDLDNEGKNQQLSADVVYYIHLGNFGRGIDTDGDKVIDVQGNVNNYDIERNISYTYTITIYGVDKIQVEVEEHREDESGAMGHVYVAKEQIFTFDSHFGSALVSFDAAHLTDLDHMTWYVRTPFGREGKPYIVNGVEVPAGLDYQWVQFKRNAITPEEVYSKKQEKYDPTAVKDVLEFSKYIKEQKEKFDKDMLDGRNDYESDFRREFDEDWYQKFGVPAGKDRTEDGEWYRHRIYLTIFVDEFYYDANPLTNDVRQDLWKDFVNQPPRLMHILCDAEKSQDEDSRTTGSVVTIRQYSIQTIFNAEKPDLMTAWGSETIDETRDSLYYYSEREGYMQSTDPNYPKGYMVWKPFSVPRDFSEWMGNDSQGNGLYNTVRLWGLIDKGAYKTKPWSNYVDPDLDFGLCDSEEGEIRTLRYSCMTRNRDENGNGYIDAKEVKWYMAAISQLGSLYVGDQGLSADAVLYPYYKQKYTENDLDEKTKAYHWRSHVVSSTAFYNVDKEEHYPYPFYPEIMWAEEGLSTGSYEHTWGKSAGLTVRCVRNLGMDPADEETAQSDLMNEKNISAQAVSVSGPGLGNNEPVTPNSVYTFDLTNLNPLSIRYYTTQELEPNNEFSVEARPYWRFETGPMSYKLYTYPELFDLIRDGKSPCPDGYRTPNVREGALMSLRIDKSVWQPTATYGRVSTYYSHGKKEMVTDHGKFDIGMGQDVGPDRDHPNYSWLFDTERVRIDQGLACKIRCVRDIRQ